MKYFIVIFIFYTNCCFAQSFFFQTQGGKVYQCDYQDCIRPLYLDSSRNPLMDVEVISPDSIHLIFLDRASKVYRKSVPLKSIQGKRNAYKLVPEKRYLCRPKDSAETAIYIADTPGKDLVEILDSYTFNYTFILTINPCGNLKMFNERKLIWEKVFNNTSAPFGCVTSSRNHVIDRQDNRILYMVYTDAMLSKSRCSLYEMDLMTGEVTFKSKQQNTVNAAYLKNGNIMYTYLSDNGLIPNTFIYDKRKKKYYRPVIGDQIPVSTFIRF